MQPTQITLLQLLKDESEPYSSLHSSDIDSCPSPKLWPSEAILPYRVWNKTLKETQIADIQFSSYSMCYLLLSNHCLLTLNQDSLEVLRKFDLDEKVSRLLVYKSF